MVGWYADGDRSMSSIYWNPGGDAGIMWEDRNGVGVFGLKALFDVAWFAQQYYCLFLQGQRQVGFSTIPDSTGTS